MDPPRRSSNSAKRPGENRGGRSFATGASCCKTSAWSGRTARSRAAARWIPVVDCVFKCRMFRCDPDGFSPMASEPRWLLNSASSLVISNCETSRLTISKTKKFAHFQKKVAKHDAATRLTADLILHLDNKCYEKYKVLLGSSPAARFLLPRG